MATVPAPIDEVKRVMLHTGEHGVLLYLYDSIEDTACFGDEWYESLEDVEGACRDRYGITTWVDVPDPEPGCFHDRIAPVRRP